MKQIRGTSPALLPFQTLLVVAFHPEVGTNQVRNSLELEHGDDDLQYNNTENFHGISGPKEKSNWNYVSRSFAMMLLPTIGMYSVGSSASERNHW